MMSGIKGKNTTPEKVIRSALHKGGFRFRLHKADMPGRPDIVLPKYRAVIFVHGCFWHQHKSCKYAKLPSSNANFWAEKLKTNVLRDARNIQALLGHGWRVFVIWECLIRSQKNPDSLHKALDNWIRGTDAFAEIPEPSEGISYPRVSAQH